MKNYSINQLKKFLYRANLAGYASGQENRFIKEKDYSTSIHFHQGNWQMHDNYFDAEPYGGRLVVFHQDKPVWMMVYYGWVEPVIEPENIYPFLQEALKKMPKDMPLRGPKELVEGNLRYINHWQGDLKRYFGEEKITLDGEVIYQAKYMGGEIDKT